jgi:hypothetical protein
MNIVTSLLRQGLLALALAGTTLGAAADPISYHVNLATAGLESGTYLDFLFTRFDGAAPTTARVFNLTGGLGALAATGGAAVVNLDGTFSIDNGPDALNYVDFLATFGGPFSFDVTFSDGFLAGLDGVGSTFSISVLDADFAPIGNVDGLVQFNLSADGGIVANPLPGNSAELIGAAQVPEPSAVLMMMTGLGLVGLVRRRKAAAAI